MILTHIIMMYHDVDEVDSLESDIWFRLQLWENSAKVRSGSCAFGFLSSCSLSIVSLERVKWMEINNIMIIESLTFCLTYIIPCNKLMWATHSALARVNFSNSRAVKLRLWILTELSIPKSQFLNCSRLCLAFFDLSSYIPTGDFGLTLPIFR